MPYSVVIDTRRVVPSDLPPARGPLTEALFDLLTREVGRPRVTLPPVAEGDDDPLFGDDSALALHTLYALHQREFERVDVTWEWQPDLLAWRRDLERAVVHRLHDEVGDLPSTPQIPDALRSRVESSSGHRLAQYLLQQGTDEQFREAAQHQSVSREMLRRLFGQPLIDRAPDTSYQVELSLLPGWTLAGANALILFAFHRRWLGAVVGYLTAVEMRTVDQVGAPGSTAADDLARELVQARPQLARDVLFGGATALALDDEAARRTIDAWERGQSSLLFGASPT